MDVPDKPPPIPPVSPDVQATLIEPVVVPLTPYPIELIEATVETELLPLPPTL